MCERAAEMGTSAVIGVNIDYQTVGSKGSMLMVAATGTAVKTGWSAFRFYAGDTDGSESR